jgi:hypothetical protein
MRARQAAVLTARQRCARRERSLRRAATRGALEDDERAVDGLTILSLMIDRASAPSHLTTPPARLSVKYVVGLTQIVRRTRRSA